jgi:hypothetical protein
MRKCKYESSFLVLVMRSITNRSVKFALKVLLSGSEHKLGTTFRGWKYARAIIFSAITAMFIL